MAAMQRRRRRVPWPLRRSGLVTSTMLIHAMRSPSGKASALAIQSPPALWMPKAEPDPIINRQSAATWFQPASADSGHTPSASPSRTGRIGGSTASEAAAAKAAIAHLIVRRLAEARTAALEPIDGPADHPL